MQHPVLQERSCVLIAQHILPRLAIVHDWFGRHELSNVLPLYSSVDIRDAGFKVAVVDTNLFPAGFNNLCEHGLADSVTFMRQAILNRVPHCRNILIIAEEHTRNTWYLENVRILEKIIHQAGFNAQAATFLSIQPAFCENINFIELETATREKLRLFCLKNLLNSFRRKEIQFDLIIMNNDLTSGIPELLKNSTIPIYPSIQAGWHSRLKSRHFIHAQKLIEEFAEIISLDPWLFSAFFAVEDQIDINIEQDRQRLMDSASDLFKKVRKKYDEHSINEKPFLFIKADSGTYGMAVLPIEDPQEVLGMNRKDRNKLYRGKNARVVNRYLLQEGIPTIYSIDQEVSEVCIYQVENNLVGGFYRSHARKGERENLNSKGMEFKKMCPHSRKYGDCGVHHDWNIFDVYRLLARIAAIAAHREIKDLKEQTE